MLRFALVLVAALCTLSLGHAGQESPAKGSEFIRYQYKEESSCAAWTKAKNSRYGQTYSARAWMFGYVTGVGAAGHPLAKTTCLAIEAWTDKYCAEHPLDALADAGEALVDELAARAKR